MDVRNNKLCDQKSQNSKKVRTCNLEIDYCGNAILKSSNL